MFPESHEKLLMNLLSIRRIPERVLEADAAESALQAERAKQEQDRARRRRTLEADRAPRRLADKLYPPVGRIDCPECGCSSRGERFRRYVSLLDIEQVEYVECGAEYLCNAPMCRDGQGAGHCDA